MLSSFELPDKVWSHALIVHAPADINHNNNNNNHNNNNNNKMTSLAPISSENPRSVAQQNQRIRQSRDHVQCKKSSTDGWRCQEAKEDRHY